MSEEERYFAKGRHLLKKELDIVQFVRKIRRLEAIVENLKLQLDLKDWSYHEAKSELKVIKID